MYTHTHARMHTHTHTHMQASTQKKIKKPGVRQPAANARLFEKEKWSIINRLHYNNMIYQTMSIIYFIN